MVFLTLFFIPAILALGFFIFGNKQITLKEFLSHLALQGLLTACCIGIMYAANTSDHEILNGTIVSKSQKRVACEHSYSCNCRQECSGSGENQSCSTVCDTCYDHSYDYNWMVYTDVPELPAFKISRVNRQGTQEPPRFKAVVLGEAFSGLHAYTNYIKGAPQTLFRHHGLVEKYQSVLPPYPDNIYDYHRLNRLVVINGAAPDPQHWNQALTDLNRTLGKLKQVNIIVVLVYNQDHEIFWSLQQAWLGGKKNDVILTIGVDATQNIQWSEVMAWTDNHLFKVQLRDAILAGSILDRTTVIKALETYISQGYQRKSMKDFEYLNSMITPTPTQWIISMVLGIIASLLLGWMFWQNDCFGDENHL